MKRTDFLKRIGLLSAVAITAPILVSEILKKEEPKVIWTVPKGQTLKSAKVTWENGEKYKFPDKPTTITLPKSQPGDYVNIINTGNEWLISGSSGSEWEIL